MDSKEAIAELKNRTGDAAYNNWLQQPYTQELLGKLKELKDAKLSTAMKLSRSVKTKDEAFVELINADNLTLTINMINTNAKIL